MKRVIIFFAIVCGILSDSLEKEALQEFVSGNRKFAAGFYKYLIEGEKENVVYSPLSAETILALTNEGARGKTHVEIVTGLSLPNTTEKTRAVFKNLLPKLKKTKEDLQLLSANKIYSADHLKLSTDYNSIAKSIYNSSLESIDFTKTEKALKTINNWVEDNTNHKIKGLIDPTLLPPTTVLVLVNALYFDGKWLYKFKENETRKNKFYRTKEDSKDVDTMHLKALLEYYESPSLNAKFLKLPYKGDDLQMVIVLPNEIDGTASLEQNIEQIFQPQPYKTAEVDVKLPKFSIETTIDLNTILQNLGIQTAFTLAADFSGFTGNGHMSISTVIQKAFISVAETGTKAAAATAVIFNRGPLQERRYREVDFHADHAFLYYITYEDIVVFAGRFNNP